MLAKTGMCFLLFLFFLAPVTNVLSTPVAAVAHADDGFCSGGNNVASTCLSSIVYLFAVYLPTNFAYATGYLFNFALQLGLNSASYALNFLSQGWAIVRDIANLSFIFILIYIAYTIIIEAETSGTMRTLAWVIIMALLINFSFFITRAVIDAGNILAIQFYNALPITASVQSPLGNNNPPTYVKDLTSGVMNATQIQTILSDKSFQAFTATNGASGVTVFLKNLGVQVLVFIAMGILISILGFIFLMVGLKFLIRVIILWITIIASPLAFAAHALPNNKKIKGYYDLWLDHLLHSSFYPAVFLFLFFIFTLFMNTLAGQTGLISTIFTAGNNATASAGNTLGVISIIGNVGIRVGLITLLLYFAMSFSDKFSEEGSGAARSLISWTGSKAANAVAGSSGWAARNTAGRAANAAAQSAGVQKFAANSVFGRPVMASLKGIAGSSLDVRGVSGLRSVAGRAGIDLNNAPKTSFVKQVGARVENVKARAKELKNSAYTIEQAKKNSESMYDRDHGGAGAYAARIAELAAEKEKIEAQKHGAEKDSAELKASGHLEEAANALEVAKAFEKQSADKSKEAADTTTAMTGYGLKKISELENKRLDAFADRIGKERLANMYLPSRGSVEGAAKVRARDLEPPKDHGGGHGDDHGEKKAASHNKKEEKKSDAGHDDGHDNTHHLMLAGIKNAVQTQGSNQAAANAILGTVAERLAQSNRLSQAQLDEAKRKIIDRSSMQTPNNPSGKPIPPQANWVGGAIDFGGSQRPQRTSADIRQSIDERKQSKQNPPTNDPGPDLKK